MRNILVVILIFMCTFTFAQDESKTSIAGGAKALVFEFDGLDNLSADSYQGGIGAKLFLNNSMALRMMFNFDRLSEEDPANPATGLEGTNGEYINTNFGLGAGLEIHLGNKSRVSPYFGGGLGFTYGSAVYKPPIVYDQGASVTRVEQETTGIYQFNLVGIIGAELFILKEVSLSAEYMLSIGFYGNGDTKYTPVAVSGTPPVGDSYTLKGNSGWYIGTGSAGQLLLSIYF